MDAVSRRKISEYILGAKMSTSIQFLGAAGEVTGSCYYIRHENTQFLVDCGMFQGSHDIDQKNHAQWPFKASEIEFVLVTHAHFDHTGRLPKLYHDGFRGRIYSTAATAELAQYILADAADLQYRQARQHRTLPLYSLNEVKALSSLYATVKYDDQIHLADDIEVLFRDAGHILGSAIIELTVGGKKLVFSGDLGNEPVPLMHHPETVAEADVLFMESTYGDRLHPKEDRILALRQAILDVVKSKGTLLIPAFAVERTQELLYNLNEMHEKKSIPDIPIFVDSPLAIEVTGVFRRWENMFDGATQTHINHGDDIFAFPHLKYSTTVEESKAINLSPSPKVVIAGSGMMNGGRILHHLIQYAPLASTIICVVGFQVPGTLGRRFLDGDRQVHILHQEVTVNAEVRNIPAFSAHADQAQLIEWVKHFQRVGKIILIHGEDDPRHLLGQKLAEAVPSVKIEYPTFESVLEI